MIHVGEALSGQPLKISAQYLSNVDGSLLTSAVLTQADITILPNATAGSGSAGVQTSNNSPAFIADGNGYLTYELTATDTNHSGGCTITIWPAAAFPVQFRVTLVAALSTVQLKNIDDQTSRLDFSGSGNALKAEPIGYVAPDNAGITTLLDRLTATRASGMDHLPKLNISGLVASQADVAAITQAQRVRLVIPPMLERPDAGTQDYRLYIYSYGPSHLAEDLDSNPTVTAENAIGTDRSSNLSLVTQQAGSGVYFVDYTLDVSSDIEQLLFRVTATKDAVATEYSVAALVVDTTAVDFTSDDRSKLQAIHQKLPTRPYLVGTDSASGQITTSDVQAPAAAAITAANLPNTTTLNSRTLASASYATLANQTTLTNNTNTLLNRLGAWTGSGGNTILGAFRSLMSKAIEKPSDITGGYDPATDSLEALGEQLNELSEQVETVTQAVGTGVINVTSHQLPSGSIVIVRGDTYQVSNERPLHWINETGAEWPDDLTGAVIVFTAVMEAEKGKPTADVAPERKIIATGYVHQAAAPNQEVRCELVPADTTKEPGLYNYDVEATLPNGEVHTLVTTAQQSLQSALGSLNQRKAKTLLEILPDYSQPIE